MLCKSVSELCVIKDLCRIIRMYFVVLYVLLLVENAFSGACNTPHNERGQCVPLVDCPKIMDAMANSNPKNEEYLRKFICKTQSNFEVCCGIASDFTVNTGENEIPTSVGDSDIKIPVHYGIFCEHSLYKDNARDLPLTVSEIRVRNLKSDVEFTKCVGLLLNPRYVLARASCLKKSKETYEFEVVGIQVRIGLVSNNSVHTFGIEEKVIHPFYDETTGTNDIALLRVNTTINEDYPKICLPFWSPYKLEDIVAVYSTFETPSNGTANNRKFFSNTECQQALKDIGLNITITNYEMCLKNDAGDTHNFCNESDKGWPLAVLRKHEKNFFVEGIPSAKTTCFTERPLVVYTNITTYTKWIKNHMKPWPYKETRCVMPHGETGYCCHLYQCPVLQEVFANPKKDSLQYLNKFICTQTGVNNNRNLFTGNFEHVCCSASLNSTILKNHIIKHVAGIQNLPPEFLERETCGLQHRDDYYFSDDVVTIDEFPWMVILIDANNKATYKSIGALINARYVVTSLLKIEDPSSVLVRLGDFHRFNGTDCVQEFGIDAEDCSNSMDYEIEEAIPHPFYYSYSNNQNYGKKVFLNAIILLRLKRTVYYSDYIRPLCLPLLPETRLANIGDMLYMSTWSLLTNKEFKRKFPFVLIPQLECQPFPLEDLLNLNGCVELPKNESELLRCIDTRGTGIMMSHNNFKWHLEGIFVSEALVTCASGEQRYTYVNVSKYLDWILENMQPWTSDEY